MGKITVGMRDTLVKEGWVKTIEGWIDPISKDKCSLNAAWNRRKKRMDIENMRKTIKKK